MLQIDTGRSAIIFAGTVNDLGTSKASQVFVHGLGGKSVGVGAPAVEFSGEVVVGVLADEVFGEAIWLNEGEPVLVNGGHLLVDGFEDVMGGDDVENGGAGDAMGVVEEEAVEDSAAAIMSAGHEGVEVELMHQFDEVLGGGAFGVGVVLRVGWGAVAVAVAAQVWADDGEVRGQGRCDFVPHDVGLGVAVEEE